MDILNCNSVLLASALVLSAAAAEGAFVDFETAPVHPVALGPNGRTLAVGNLPDGRVELFDVSSGLPTAIGDVPVGVDPVSVRWRSTNELWVVNHISSSVSVVDVARRLIVATLQTKAGPADVVFSRVTKSSLRNRRPARGKPRASSTTTGGSTAAPRWAVRAASTVSWRHRNRS